MIPSTPIRPTTGKGKDVSRHWRESAIATAREREKAALRKITAWLNLPLSERVKRKERYRQTLECCQDCGGRLTYSRRKAPADESLRVA